jgi:hypothetical protein
LEIPQILISPSIDPLSDKNCELTGTEVDQILTFNAASGSFDTENEELTVANLYAGLESLGFSEHVLSQVPANLAVQRVDDVEWSDLGEPNRVLGILAATGRRPQWADSFVRTRRSEERFGL